ncbi:unnamed protein product [Didymodactylos carnosus]|uniref:Uncharacterized protein n=1 Tax=Didymodactylos carnosus TaxID=1234261 RepID=A0A815UK69_9BILA|nr:unnamed protein product [Didymodactylos carnosus]CAF1518258.1 unnamed protein product [Didymodactylos carnosus]CAF3606833.1 unnamed protein product [Didymodactylos carnosus]CAF4377973.1 unnamed protein product [Didymodactylos carnosus]
MAISSATLSHHPSLYVGEPIKILYDPEEDSDATTSEKFDEKFNNTIDCLQHIHKNKTKRFSITMILRMIEKEKQLRPFIRSLQELVHVISMYIMCNNIEYYTSWLNDYSKLQPIIKIENALDLQLTEIFTVDSQQQLEYHSQQAQLRKKSGEHGIEAMHLREGQKCIQQMQDRKESCVQFLKRRQRDDERKIQLYERQKDALAKQSAELIQREVVATVDQIPTQATP